MLTLVFALSLAAADPAPARVTTPLMQAHAGRLTASASTTWPGWEAARLIDGDPETSWFSAKGDSAGKGKKPWIEVAFKRAVVVNKVTLLGNREPSWPTGFTSRYGVLELLGKNGTVLATMKNEGKNPVADVDFVFKAPVTGVRKVRFTSLMDEGDQTVYEDIAIGEVLVE